MPFFSLCNQHVRQVLVDGLYACWNFSVQSALCAAVPVLSIGPRSKSWWDPTLQSLLDKRADAYAALAVHCNAFKQNHVPDLTADLVWQDLWNTYAHLRRQAHDLVQSNKARKWAGLLSKLHTEFDTDKRHFFATVQRLRSSRSSSSATIASLQVPSNSSLPSSGRVTSDPEEMKKILFEHHARLCQNPPPNPAFDASFEEETLAYVQSISTSEVGPPFCEQPPALAEVTAALKSAANHKASGLDTLFNESLKAGGALLSSSLTQLFCSFWQLEATPAIWSHALIHLIPKGHDADMLLPSSYRPISLTSAVSKVFEKVMLTRLDCYADESELFPDEQAGFRKGRSPLEQAYILREILDARKQIKKATTFLCFIDLESAFPSSWRDGMWRRLHEANVSGKMFRLIKSLYVDCSSALLTDSGLSDWFPVEAGTRQGAVLSPFLFSLLISPLVDALHAVNMGIDFFGLRIGCLLFADDIVLIADSESHLQAMMDVATRYFSKWRFTVSTTKSKVVSLGHCETRTLKDRSWHLGGRVIKDVASYTYLGIEFDKSGNWLNAIRKNIEKCRHSMGHLYSFTDNPDQGLTVGHLSSLWGLFARSRLLYGSEIWSAPSASALESLEAAQTSAGRQILGKAGDSNIIREAVYGDLGWFSVRSYLRLAKLRFLTRLLCLPDDRLAKRVFKLAALQFNASCTSLFPPTSTPSCWCKEAYEILVELGIESWWTSGLPLLLMQSVHALKRECNRRVSDLDNEEWLQALHEPPVQQTGLSAREHYLRIKTCKSVERYLFSDDRKSALIKFYLRSRCFGLNARTQHGDGDDITDRKACSLCNLKIIEDEEHFLLVCPEYSVSRRLMWFNIEAALEDSVWAHLALSPPRLQLDYLLGRCEAGWHRDIGTLLDSLVRTFLLTAASVRKSRMQAAPTY